MSSDHPDRPPNAPPVADDAGAACAATAPAGAEQPRVEQELRESREHFRLLFDEAPCYISVQDRDLRIVRANRRFKEAFGDQEGARCFELYKHRREPCLRCPVAETFTDGKSHHSEEVVTAASGAQIYTLVSTAPIVGLDGEVELVMEMSTDISRVRELQGQLTNLGLLIGSVSHGIKGLLTGLDGGLYLLTSGVERSKPGRVDQGLQMIRRNVGHVRSVLKDLLYLAGDEERSLELVELGALARDVAAAMQRRATDLGIDLSVEIAPGAATCEADAASLKESLRNILGYAFEACRLDSGKQTHRVRFALSQDADDVQITIEDDGIGMDRETRERIFSLHFASQGGPGSGLGLFTASKVIERHRGVIEVSSEPRQGACFMIRIPRARAGA